MAGIDVYAWGGTPLGPYRAWLDAHLAPGCIYFDALSQFEVGDSPIDTILGEGLVEFDYDVVSLFRKDSLELTDEDRLALKEFIAGDDGGSHAAPAATPTIAPAASRTRLILNIVEKKFHRFPAKSCQKRSKE